MYTGARPGASGGLIIANSALCFPKLRQYDDAQAAVVEDDDGDDDNDDDDAGNDG